MILFIKQALVDIFLNNWENLNINNMQMSVPEILMGPVKFGHAGGCLCFRRPCSSI